ncbi:hypothetical protein CAP35_10915 [Chitinophagaceae bacterium IBVUCB1]|jgi:hypothetical protein|nr:hypothetical protein CAP35_10915 [Chitinophagaceae bacterium IBVUCB1]
MPTLCILVPMLRISHTDMKWKILLISLLVITAWGCRRTSPTPEPYYEPDYGELKYIIQGLKDVSLERTGEVKLNVYINRTEGRIEDVMMSVLNLPQGVTASFSPSISKPSYNTTLTIKASRAKEGTYSIIVRGSSQTSGFTEKKINITILSYSNAAIGLEGQFKEAGQCSPGGTLNHDVDIVPSDTVNKILIKGFWSSVWTHVVRADLNVANKTLSIPSQTVNGVTITGNGTYDDNLIIIGYRVKGLTVNDTCTSSFSRL